MEDENTPEPSAPPRRKSFKSKVVRPVEVISHKEKELPVGPKRPPPPVISGQSYVPNHSTPTKPPAKPPPPKIQQLPEAIKKIKPMRPPVPQSPAAKEKIDTVSKPKPIPRPKIGRPVPAPRSRNSKSSGSFTENADFSQQQPGGKVHCPESQKDNIECKLSMKESTNAALTSNNKSLERGRNLENKLGSNDICEEDKNISNMKKKAGYENVTIDKGDKKNPYENIELNLQPVQSNAITLSSIDNIDNEENKIIDNLEDCVINIPSKSGNMSRPYIFHQCNSGKEISDVLKDNQNLPRTLTTNPTPLVSYSKLRPDEQISDDGDDENTYSNVKSKDNLPENLYSAPMSNEDIYSEPPSYPIVAKDRTLSDLSFHSSARNSTANTSFHQDEETDYSVPLPVPNDTETYSVPTGNTLSPLHVSQKQEVKNCDHRYIQMDGGMERPSSEYEEIASIKEPPKRSFPSPTSLQRRDSGKTREEQASTLEDNVYASVDSLLLNAGSRREEILTSESESESEEESSSSDDEHGFKAKSKLFHIAYEILSTEKSFVEALALICEDFGNPLKAAIEKNPRLLPEGGYNQMFMNIELIYELDKKFLHDLEERMENWEQHKRIGDLVREYGHYLKMYTTYIKGYDNAISMYHDCITTNMRFSQLVKDFEKLKKAKNLKLTSYLLKPIQRIPSYRLLLKDYLKHLPEDSIDYNDIKGGVAIVSEVANYINESMREGEKFQEVLRIQSQIVNANDIIKPGRFLLKEGVLQKLSRKELQERTFILFTDALLYCMNLGHGQMKLIAELPLAGMIVQYPDSQELSNEFSVISTKRSFLLNASSPKEREDWVAALEDAVSVVNGKLGTFTKTLKKDTSEVIQENITDIGAIAPPWIPDSRVTMCQICTALFNVYNRRHHCRACGKVVCRKCSNFEAPLKYMENEAARVCEICYQSLLQKIEKNGDEILLAKFKETKGKKKLKKRVEGLPSTLTEVGAQEGGIENSGFLRLKKGNKKEKRCWFVLKEHVLYLYKASSDPAASSTIPVLGYELDVTGNWNEDEFVFQLKHQGVKDALVFRAENRTSAERWVHFFCKATALLPT